MNLQLSGFSPSRSLRGLLLVDDYFSGIGEKPDLCGRSPKAPRSYEPSSSSIDAYEKYYYIHLAKHPRCRYCTIRY